MQRLMTALATVMLALPLAAPAQAQERPYWQTVPDAATPQASDWRTVSEDRLLVIDTTKGRILVEMAPEAAPAHVERIRLLAARGFYDGLLWHRVIDNFMAQTGDPLGTGDGQSPFPDLKGEFTFRRDSLSPFEAVAAPAGSLVGFLHSLPIQTQPDEIMAGTADRKVHGWGLYCAGVAGMARDDNPDSANSQFFLMRQPYPPLDKRYTIWGKVISGLDVVRALKFSPNPDGLVTDPDRMERVRVVADMTEGDKPSVRVLDPASAQFRALVEATRQARGADFSICDIDLPVQVS
ncbi:peptidylprolyl isomerase [Brevundimonas vesicularis]|uniref:peptidylprolyl isomerase n=1 Tax=Brevundimonas vesicularis TaxID=41276 RepID=UPI0038D4AFBE